MVFTDLWRSWLMRCSTAGMAGQHASAKGTDAVMGVVILALLLILQPCAVPKLAHSRLPAAFRWLRCSAVFADQSANDGPALDPSGDIDGMAELAQRATCRSLWCGRWPL